MAPIDAADGIVAREQVVVVVAIPGGDDPARVVDQHIKGDIGSVAEVGLRQSTRAEARIKHAGCAIACEPEVGVEAGLRGPRHDEFVAACVDGDRLGLIDPRGKVGGQLAVGVE